MRYLDRYPRAVLAIASMIVAVVVWLAILAPLSDWRAANLQALQATQSERVRLEASIARLTAQKQSFVSEDIASLMWQGRQAAEATAKVQAAVNDMARTTGIVMRSIAPTNANSSGISGAISFRLEFEASLDHLLPFLKALEFGQPALVVTRGSLRRLVRPNQTGVQPDLFVQLDVAAPLLLDDGSAG